MVPIEARYRKLYSRIWRHKDFLPLDPIDKALVLYCLTGPQTNRIGFYVFSPGTAAEEVGVPLRSLQSRVAKICKIFGWQFDPLARVLLIPSWWTWNKPENANVLKGALKDADELPASTLWERWAYGSRNVCQTLGVTFPERLGHGSPIQEQDQEQEQEPEKRQRTAAPPPAPIHECAKPVENFTATGAVADAKAKVASGPPVAVPFPVVAALVRSTLAEGRDWSYPGGEVDLVEELKTRCAKHRIAYDSAAIQRALDSERHKATHGLARKASPTKPRDGFQRLSEIDPTDPPTPPIEETRA